MTYLRRHDLDDIINKLSTEMIGLINEGKSMRLSTSWIQDTIIDTGLKTTAINKSAAVKLRPEIERFINKEIKDEDFRDALYYAVVESLPANVTLVGDN